MKNLHLTVFVTAQCWVSTPTQQFLIATNTVATDPDKTQMP